MSDCDVLSLAINKKTDLIVFNTSDLKSGRGMYLDFEYTINNFQNRLINKFKIIEPSSERICIREGIAEGKIIGCNLTSILKLAGTPYFPDFENKILFIEGYRESTKRIITILEQLKQIGIFNKIKGIVIGYIYGFEDPKMIKKNNIKCKYENLVLEVTKEYNFPILKTHDFGHHTPNCCIPIGAKVRIDAKNKFIEIIEDFLE